MPHDDAPYCLVIDTNIWVAERLLRSSVGSALLYTLTGSKAFIGLPEVIELETSRTLEGQAKKALDTLRSNVDFLRQLSEHSARLPVPTEHAVQEGIARRWKDLDGMLVRAPFTLEQARLALQRTMDHLPPSSDNNEQFRDCCIWESVLGFLDSHTVHFITNDSAFYRSRDRNGSLATCLQDDAERVGNTVHIYPSIAQFLTQLQATTAVLDEEAIKVAIVAAVTPRARAILAEETTQNRSYELGPVSHSAIKGYATPKPSLVAVTFGIAFDFDRVENLDGEERRFNSTLQLDGTCSYAPDVGEVSGIVVKVWHKTIRGYPWGETTSYVPELQRQIEQTRYI
jgi:hypothetical protein